jgi:nicotinate-nucleotide pyrophosphorylase (carboxylating)
MNGPVPSLEACTEMLVAAALAEDVGPGDFTTQWTVPQDHVCRAVIVAKQALVVAGVAPVLAVFAAVDEALNVTAEVGDGDAVEEGAVLFRLAGPTRAVLTGERAALNFLGHLSGVATQTRRFVDAVAGTGAEVIDTRKTTPGWRLLEKAAVRAGGGANHRAGLHDMVLVKDNHADAAGGVAIAAARALQANDRGIPVEVEVRSLDELGEVLALGVDRILLDNMDTDTLCEAAAEAHKLGSARPELEASGGVTLSTVRAVAETGVDFISVGALTHSAPSADVSLRVIG